MYHAVTESGEDRAIKVYKTSILVFKDRDRYVSGEFRFRHGYSRHNPRQMVKVWAEKEMRNLKRCVPARVRGGPRADSSSRHGSAAARRARRGGGGTEGTDCSWQASRAQLRCYFDSMFCS